MNLINKALEVGAMNVYFNEYLLPKQQKLIEDLITKTYDSIPCDETVVLYGKDVPILRYGKDGTQLVLTPDYLVIQVEDKDDLTATLEIIKDLISKIFEEIEGIKFKKFGVRNCYVFYNKLVTASNFNSYFKPVLQKDNIFGEEFNGRSMPDLEIYKNGDFEINFQYMAFDNSDPKKGKSFILDFDIFTTKLIPSNKSFIDCLTLGIGIMEKMFNSCINKKIETKI